MVYRHTIRTALPGKHVFREVQLCLLCGAHLEGGVRVPCIVWQACLCWVGGGGYIKKLIQLLVMKCHSGPGLPDGCWAAF